MHESPSLLIADAVRVFGGAERFVLDAARGLRDRGWRVTVLAYPGRPLAARAREAGLDVHTARTRANGAPWTVLPLALWCARRRFDAVLSVYDKDLRTAAWAARLACPGTAIVHSRECDTPIKDRPWIRAFHTRIADHVITNSEATRRTTLHGSPWLAAGRVSVVPKGIDLAPYEVERGARRDGPVRFGFAGQLVARKRVELLIDAVAALDVPAELRIAGVGPERVALEARVRSGANVRFDGFVEDMPAWYRTIDVFVLPSLVEGWGYVAAEAAAAGCAVVAFAASSLPEVVPEEAGAILADPADALEPALRSVVDEGPTGWASRGRRLREHAFERLGLDTMLSNLENRLHEVIASRRRPSTTPRSS